MNVARRFNAWNWDGSRDRMRRVATPETLAKAVGRAVSQLSGVATRRAHRGAPLVRVLKHPATFGRRYATKKCSSIKNVAASLRRGELSTFKQKLQDAHHPQTNLLPTSTTWKAFLRGEYFSHGPRHGGAWRLHFGDKRVKGKKCYGVLELNTTRKPLSAQL